MKEAEQIEAGIAELEAQRGALGDSVVVIALASLRARLAALRGEASDQNPNNGPTAARISFGSIKDGTSNQIMIGEKYLNRNAYTTSTDGGDNECAYTGMNNDVVRATYSLPLQDTPNQSIASKRSR